MTPLITVVGIGADGWDSLSADARQAVAGAEVVLGGHRHLAMLPPLDARLEPWPSPLREQLPALLRRYDGDRIVALASGDPLLSGIASTLVSWLGAERVEVLPAVSSVALARARMRWPAETAEVVRLVGDDLSVVRRHLAPGRRLVVLSADAHTPAAVAELLDGDGWGTSRVTVLSDLGSAEEQRLALPAREWRGRKAPALNVVCIECRPDPATPVLALVPGLPDDAFEHDGQITKRDLRAAALARLAPTAGALLWDVGAGAGSVAIEWLRIDTSCRAVAVEAAADRAARISRNAERLGVPGLQVRHGRAPEALAGLPTPDAVFVGGGATAPEVLDICWDALRDGGRMVVHAVTLETEQRLVEMYHRHGGELTRLCVEHAQPIGRFTGWEPARPVVQWAATRKEHL
ncbi:precorrin-6y C5,15-methyltransferase (decarboxylating) subunit CbiE [Nocardia australiensis]|uniref:precorrin-6y C5,15-methyltransferase (decarboxylating) subunit CbiE n=1 Tax=Nocardia australiensis TaxID=2887191 RepID=UPI001D153375|nr:precorrin-6y C5,15-methyltransferase (decarboxylating) subunit CbiE [Nocardia australiensis]